MRGDEFFKMLAVNPPFTKMNPKLAGFFKEYLSNEKVISFEDKYVINTHFPPYPSPSFNRLIEQFSSIGSSGANRKLFSVTWAITNRCHFNCWHCYNAGRSQYDIDINFMKKIADTIQNLGATIITLTGGEPLLRDDLEDILSAFDNNSSLILGTTGDGLTLKKAKKMKSLGLFAIGISLDSKDESCHDKMRGRKGAFKIALRAIKTSLDAGLYPYIVSTATKEFLQRKKFLEFMEFAKKQGAKEVHLIEPSPTGKLFDNKEVVLSAKERKLIFNYQKEIAEREDLPILSSFTYLESENAFGCGAGLSHIYIDGSGEICPCNLVPISFGNIVNTPLADILKRMGKYFQKPRPHCVGHLISMNIPYKTVSVPTPPNISEEICRKCLPKNHKLPRFFQLHSEAMETVGSSDLKDAYNNIHEYYDEFWLSEAKAPTDKLIELLNVKGSELIFEAGCGTGYGTHRLSEKLNDAGKILAVDISQGMLDEAKKRLGKNEKVIFVCGDAFDQLSKFNDIDIIFSSWVLGYIPLKDFFYQAFKSLKKNGKIGIVVHKDHSPRQPLDIFAEIISEDPSVMQKIVSFDFPTDVNHLFNIASAVGFCVDFIKDGEITFKYKTAEEVLEHLLKSGAGTAYYDAIDEKKRTGLEMEFIKRLKKQNKNSKIFKVIHDYIICIAIKK